MVIIDNRKKYPGAVQSQGAMPRDIIEEVLNFWVLYSYNSAALHVWSI